MKSRLSLLTSFAILALAVLIPSLVRAAEPEKDAFHYNRLIGRGVNMGNCLDAPKEGEWGITLKEEYFQAVKDAGFNSVRIPIRWSAHAKQEEPYTVDTAFFERVDWAIKQALSRDLVAIINVHHYEEMDKEPEKHTPRLKAIWKQIAERYKGQPDRLYFELYNEPHDKLTDPVWNKIVPQLLETIRASNPDRIVIIGPGGWNNLRNLAVLELPEKDRRLIATFHYYDPFQFTHQGAEWAKGSEKWLGKTWTATPQEMTTLQKDLDKAAAWGKEHKRPMYLGEFGAYSKAPMESREIWTRAVAREAEKREMSWGYWEFGSGFGAYDPATKMWRKPLLNALTGKEQ